jgi:hypothetical protein
MGMAGDIVAILRLFEGRLPDRETWGWVVGLAADQSRWSDAHRVFDRVRERTLAAIAAKDSRSEAQYMFEEICLKSLYNETAALDPFDSDSPHWIIKCAIHLARQVGVPVQQIIEIVAPGEPPNVPLSNE